MNHVLVLGDQLTLEVGPLARANPAGTTVLMIESKAWGTRLGYHKQKLALIYSAMRHFRRRLEARGFRVAYHACDDFQDGLRNHLEAHPGITLTLMEPADHGVDTAIQALVTAFGGRLEVVENELWLSTRQDWEGFAQGKKQLRMEFFYRQMRTRTGWLMDGAAPAGGRWNFDAENRRVPERDHRFPPRLEFEHDSITAETLGFVETHFAHHFGTLRHFNWPVTREQALAALEHFLEHRLAGFGPFEDAMVEGEAQLYHSLLSPALNLGLLTAREVCERAIAHASDPANAVPPESIEGFVRQVLGWREFMRHVYRTRMPTLKLENRLGHERALPDFYWTGETRMRCLAASVQQVRETGHTHHIQRLMVLGNFALIAGVRPQAINDWFLTAYVDAFDWVVSPNVLGMSQYADGGSFTSKPYASGAGYINKMSNHCSSCAYNPKQTVGADACPFASLYWNFMDRHLERFASNQRMAVIVAAWRKRDPAERAAILGQAREVLERLEMGVL